MRYPKTLISLLLLSVLLLSCATVPVTGRQQLTLIPTSSLNSLSFQQYSEFMSSHQLSTDAKTTAMVKNAGNRIKDAVKLYLTQNNAAGLLQGYEWEFNQQ